MMQILFIKHSFDTLTLLRKYLVTLLTCTCILDIFHRRDREMLHIRKFALILFEYICPQENLSGSNMVHHCNPIVTVPSCIMHTMHLKIFAL